MRTTPGIAWACLVLTVASLARPAGALPADIKSAVVARAYADGEGRGVTSIFSPRNHVIHFVVTLVKPAQHAVRVVWVAVDAGGFTNLVISDKKMKRQWLNQVHNFVTLPRDWPRGRYRTDLYLDGKHKLSVSFSVK